jgi:hypothetical protein
MRCDSYLSSGSWKAIAENCCVGEGFCSWLGSCGGPGSREGVASLLRLSVVSLMDFAVAEADSAPMEMSSSSSASLSSAGALPLLNMSQKLGSANRDGGSS